MRTFIDIVMIGGLVIFLTVLMIGFYRTISEKDQKRRNRDDI